MTVMTSAGSRVSIANTLPATYDAAGFAALTWIEIAEITNVSEFGRTYALVTHMPLATRIAKKFKGSYNNGNMTLQYGKDITDAGQAAVMAALDSDNSYAIKIVLQDGTNIYCTAKVMDAKVNLGGVDSITAGSTTLEIDGNIIED